MTKEKRENKKNQRTKLPCRTMKGTEEASEMKVQIRATIIAALRRNAIFFL